MSDADLVRADGFLNADWRSLNGVFDAATLVEFLPVVGIKRWALSAIPHPIRTP
jgi:hypothetical protein